MNIIKSRNRCALSVKFECGGLYGVLFHVSYSSDGRYRDLNDVLPDGANFRTKWLIGLVRRTSVRYCVIESLK